MNHIFLNFFVLLKFFFSKKEEWKEDRHDEDGQYFLLFKLWKGNCLRKKKKSKAKKKGTISEAWVS